MEHIIEHIATALAVVLAGLASWFARKAGQNAFRASLEGVVRDAVDYAQAHVSPGISPERTALDAARLGDVSSDGKRDFTDAQLAVAIRAEFARRAKA